MSCPRGRPRGQNFRYRTVFPLGHSPTEQSLQDLTPSHFFRARCECPVCRDPCMQMLTSPEPCLILWPLACSVPDVCWRSQLREPLVCARTGPGRLGDRTDRRVHDAPRGYHIASGASHGAYRRGRRRRRAARRRCLSAGHGPQRAGRVPVRGIACRGQTGPDPPRRDTLPDPGRAAGNALPGTAGPSCCPTDNRSVHRAASQTWA